MKKIFTVLFLISSFVWGQVGSVIITEIMYNPNSPESNTQTQYIEIGNTTGNPIDIGNWTIDDEDTDGPNTIPEGTTIPAYGIVVICGGNESDFRASWSTSIDANATIISLKDNGQTMFNLSNSPSSSNEIVQLKDASSTVIDEVNYDDENPWPSDNNKSSIYLNLTPSTMTSTNNDDGNNWSLSTEGVNGAIKNIASGVWNGNDLGSPGNVQGFGTLPVELTTFSASIVKNKVELNWETATEVNNYGFNIERKPENGSWNKIGFVEGSGNSNSPKHYTFTDNTVTAGKFLYRLKQMDIDGSFEYSDAIEVDLSSPVKYELSQNFPNPFNPTTSIQFSIPEASKVKLVVYNIIGEQVAELVNKNMEAGYHNVQFNAGNLNSGIYIYKIEANNFTQIRKMTLMK